MGVKSLPEPKLKYHQLNPMRIIQWHLTHKTKIFDQNVSEYAAMQNVDHLNRNTKTLIIQ